MKKKQNSMPYQTLAVIDIGTSAIRMTIAQVDEHNEIKLLESLQQGLSLGKDTFSRGFISKNSIEDCVKALKSFKRKLCEYQITENHQIRVVATTAVREATNHQSFIDRIFIATGLIVEIIDDIDVSRLTYLSTIAYFSTHKFQKQSDVLVTEMSGGTTELLLLTNEDVLLSKSYRLGALRLREMIEEFRTPQLQVRDLIESDTQRTVTHICQDLCRNGPLTIIAIGGDARFAASQIYPDWDSTVPIKISLSALAKLTDQIMPLSADEIVLKYHLPYSDAETVGPVLLFYLHLARALDQKSITVTNISMRAGLIMEMVSRGNWSEKFSNQILNAAQVIGRKFHYDEQHAKHVETLSIALFDALKDEHRLEPWYQLHLRVAALLHDIGSFISIRSHHKHSMYLIENSDLFGFSKRDLHIIALTARYHRRSLPKPEHQEYTSLDKNSRLTVIKMAAILRVADALDRSNSQRIQEISCTRDHDTFIITLPNVDDITLEQLSLQNKGTLFEDVYGMKVILQKKATLLE